MTKTHKKTAQAVASGIHVANYDQAIGALILLGLVFFPLVPASALIGIPLVALMCWARHSELRNH